MSTGEGAEGNPLRCPIRPYGGQLQSLVGREINGRGVRYGSMALSSVQKGAIGQYAFLAAALVTGNGLLEIYIPSADNEGRDAEIRKHLKRTPGIGIQIKVAFATVTVSPENRQ